MSNCCVSWEFLQVSWCPAFKLSASQPWAIGEREKDDPHEYAKPAQWAAAEHETITEALKSPGTLGKAKQNFSRGLRNRHSKGRWVKRNNQSSHAGERGFQSGLIKHWCQCATARGSTRTINSLENVKERKTTWELIRYHNEMGSKLYEHLTSSCIIRVRDYTVIQQLKEPIDDDIWVLNCIHSCFDFLMHTTGQKFEVSKIYIFLKHLYFWSARMH